MEYEILGSVWFSNDSIGIIAIKSGDGWKAYIGVSDLGEEEADAREIAKNGMPVGKGIACGAFPMMDAEKFLN